jgi:integrase
MTKVVTRRKRPTYGDGSIFYEAARDRWVGELPMPKKDGKAQRPKKFTRKTRPEVEKAMREARRARDDGKALGDARDTVGALLDDWQARGYPLTRAKSANTLAGYDWAIGHIKGSLAGVRIRELSADDVEVFLDEKMSPSDESRPLGHRSIVQLQRVLTTALQWGKRNKRIAENVGQDVVTPAEGSRRPSRAFTPDEITALLTAAASVDQDAIKHVAGSRATPLEAAWSVMAGLGLRPGECFALTWDNVDFEGAKLYVRGSLVRDQRTNTLYVGPTKTAKSRRDLDVPAPVLDALREHRAWQRKHRLKAGESWDQESGFVFTNETGGLLDPSATRRRFKKLCVAAGLGANRHPHELRHSCASYLSVVLGLPLEQVADVLGHSGINTLLAVYRHVVTPSIPHALGTAALFPVRPASG